MTVLSRSCVDQTDDVGRGTDVAERPVDGMERGVVVLVAACRVGVGNEDDAVAQGARIASRRFAAHVGDGAGDEDGVNASFIQ